MNRREIWTKINSPKIVSSKSFTESNRQFIDSNIEQIMRHGTTLTNTSRILSEGRPLISTEKSLRARADTMDFHSSRSKALARSILSIKAWCFHDLREKE